MTPKQLLSTRRTCVHFPGAGGSHPFLVHKSTAWSIAKKNNNTPSGRKLYVVTAILRIEHLALRGTPDAPRISEATEPPYAQIAMPANSPMEGVPRNRSAAPARLAGRSHNIGHRMLWQRESSENPG